MTHAKGIWNFRRAKKAITAVAATNPLNPPPSDQSAAWEKASLRFRITPVTLAAMAGRAAESLGKMAIFSIHGAPRNPTNCSTMRKGSSLCQRATAWRAGSARAVIRERSPVLQPIVTVILNFSSIVELGSLVFSQMF